MDLVDLARAVLRRWYVVLPVMLLAVAAAVALVLTTDPVYEARGTFLMTDPPDEGEVEDGEDTGEGLAETTTDAGLLAEILNLDPRATGGGGAETPVFEALSIAGDTLRIDAFGPSSDATVDLLDEQLAVAEDAAGGEDAVEVLARPEAAEPRVVAADEPESFQASLLLRITEPTVTEGPTVSSGYAGQVLIELLGAPDARQEILATTDDGDYSIDRNDSGDAPIFGIDVEDRSPEATEALFDQVRDVAGDRLDTLQDAAGVLEGDRLQLIPLTAPDPTSVGGDELRRPVLLVIAAGILLSLALAALVESVVRTRAKRRADDGFVSSRPPSVERDRAETF